MVQKFGFETFDILGINDDLKPNDEITIKAKKDEEKTIKFKTICRIDTPIEIEYYKNQGILNTVLRNQVAQE